MIERKEITIDCLRDEKRYLTVYVPDKEGTFPVLYMMDGQNVFFDEDATYGKSWGMYDYLVKNDVDLISQKCIQKQLEYKRNVNLK